MRTRLQFEMHAPRQVRQGVLYLGRFQRHVKTSEFRDAILPLPALQQQFLREKRVPRRHLVPVEEVGETPVSLGRAADDRRGLPVARPVPEFLERSVDAVILSRVHVEGLPSKRPEDGRQVGHGEDRLAVDIELAVVAVHHQAEVVQLLRAGEHHGFPDRPFLQFAVSAHAVRIEARRDASGDREALRHPEALTHRTGRDVDARQDWPRMAIQDAGVRARVAQHLAAEITQVGIDRGHGRHRVAFAEGEEILPAAGGVGDVDIHEPAVIQGRQRDHGRERAARVQALIHRIAALFQRQDADIGVFHGQEF